jgi:transposase
MDDGGMSIRLDPRRLGALKLLAAEAGVRPGELVTKWVEERLDAARSGAAPTAIAPDGLAALAARVDELARRLDRMTPAPAEPAPTPAPEAISEAPAKRGRGRPRKVAGDVAAVPAKARAKGATARKAQPKARAGATAKVALHDEIAAVITERGPQTAAELAGAIAERGLYHAPRSAKPLDAAAVNARVSNPIYRGRFVRRERRIGLAVE